MMTRPAASLAQLGGAVFAFVGAGALMNDHSVTGWLSLLIGLSLFFLGGYILREYHRREHGN